MKYSISDLEQLSGVSTHTIRIWERRYKALEPLRSAGNTRFYDDSHLRRLLNIVGLSQSGMKISQVCSLSEKEMDELLSEELDAAVSDDARFEYYITQLLSFGLAYDEVHFDGYLSRCIADHGIAVTYQNVIYPLLVRLGLMWRRDHICPAQEHFLSSIIRQKLFTAIDGLPVNKNPKSTWLLFLPEDEDHDIGLLYANYLLKFFGQRVIFLGAKVPLDSVKSAVAHNTVDHILLFLVRSRPLGQAESYVKELNNAFEQKIHVAGNAKLISELHLDKNMDWFQSIYDFEEAIRNIPHVS